MGDFIKVSNKMAKFVPFKTEKQFDDFVKIFLKSFSTNFKISNKEQFKSDVVSIIKKNNKVPQTAFKFLKEKNTAIDQKKVVFGGTPQLPKDLRRKLTPQVKKRLVKKIVKYKVKVNKLLKKFDK